MIANYRKSKVTDESHMRPVIKWACIAEGIPGNLQLQGSTNGADTPKKDSLVVMPFPPGCYISGCMAVLFPRMSAHRFSPSHLSPGYEQRRAGISERNSLLADEQPTPNHYHRPR